MCVYAYICVCVCLLNDTIFTCCKPGFKVPALLSCSMFRNLPSLQVRLQTLSWCSNSHCFDFTHFEMLLFPPSRVCFMSVTHSTLFFLLCMLFQRIQQNLHWVFSSSCIYFSLPYPICQIFISCWIKLQVVQDKVCLYFPWTFRVFWGQSLLFWSPLACAWHKPRTKSSSSLWKFSFLFQICILLRVSAMFVC